jgi:meiosis induction protein kinase IME2/SME1
MPILPTIRPISPLSDAVTAQASNNSAAYSNDQYVNGGRVGYEKGKKIGRQLSVASSTNHYADVHRQQAERALNGHSGLASPPSGHKESFFSHLRKRARRFSGRHQTPVSPAYDDIEAQAGCGPWASNRSSMVLDSQPMPVPKQDAYESLDKALRDVQNSQTSQPPVPPAHQMTPTSTLKRHHSLPHHHPRSVDNLIGAARGSGPISSRTRRAQAAHGVRHYDAPDEEDELLDEVLASTRRAMNKFEKDTTPNLRQSASNIAISNPYPTPSPSASGTVLFADGHEAVTPSPLDLGKKSESQYKWPTPPYEESEWAASASASIWAASNRF